MNLVKFHSKILYNKIYNLFYSYKLYIILRVILQLEKKITKYFCKIRKRKKKELKILTSTS